MGTDIDLMILDLDEKRANSGAEAVFKELKRIEQMMTAWKPTGFIYKINQDAGIKPVVVPKELYFLIKEGNQIAKLSGGLFDITYRSMGKLWDYKKKPPVLPDDALIKERIELIDYRKIKLMEKNGVYTVFLPKKGMKIDLGGIAKGYGVDRSVVLLKKMGLKRFVVNAGGDLFIQGARNSGEKKGKLWHVGIRHPRKAGKLIAELPVAGYAVVTSGDYERYFIKNGRRYCHIINPKTGYPGDLVQSVTVMAKRATYADGLATALFLMGPERGLKLVESLTGVETLIVDREGKVHLSSGFRR